MLKNSEKYHSEAHGGILKLLVLSNQKSKT